MCSGELKQQIAAKKVKFFILNKQGDVLLYKQGEVFSSINQQGGVLAEWHLLG